MSNTTTLAAPTRRLMAGLIVTTIATASAGAWALTAGATGPTDEPTTIAATVEDATADRLPPGVGSTGPPQRHRPDRRRRRLPRRRIHRLPRRRPAERRRRPLPMALDHVLPKRHRPDRRCRRLPRRRRHRVPVNPAVVAFLTNDFAALRAWHRLWSRADEGWTGCSSAHPQAGGANSSRAMPSGSRKLSPDP